MASNSIAKLAVQIVTDTAQMQQGFQRARIITAEFARETQAMGEQVKAGAFKMDVLTKQLTAASGAFGRLSPLVGALGASGGPIGAIAAAGTLAATALAGMAQHLAKLADAAGDARIIELREMFKEFGRAEFASGMETSAEHVARLNRELGESAERIGFTGRVWESFKAGLQKGALAPLNVLPGVKDWIEDGRKLQAMGEQSEATLRKQLEFSKSIRQQMAERAKVEESERQRELREIDKLAARGMAIRDSLRTPAEIFKDTVKELRALADGGYIAAETLRRGMSKAADEFERTTSGAKELRRSMQFAPALEVGTQAFRSAVLNFQNSARPGAAKDRSAEVVALLKSIDTSTKLEAKKPTVTFKTASL